MFFGNYSDINNATPVQATATYYSYDILGNVDTLIQDYRSGIMNSTNNRFKRIVYDYDLQSGKVDKVAYQHGYVDAFYHSYLYDAENRLTNVLTSADSINWDNDAYYSYYLHGPLSRTVLGDQQVQGINHAYLLQGWLKSMNPPIQVGGGNTLQADGTSGSPVAGNAYNLQLNYFNGDYLPASGAAFPTGSSSNLGTAYNPLYNGNISSMGVSIVALKHPLLYNYGYDQLNRLVKMDAWNSADSLWGNIGTTPLPDFQERVSYDPNGNILKYKRNGNNTFAGQPIGMDSLNYAYTYGTNKLDHISDSVPSGNYGNDLDNQSSGNYSYDAIGELTGDNASGITNVNWTVYGKIASIVKSNETISFTYDAAGNRVSKTVTPTSGTPITTWYVRDAQGNIMSVYTSGDQTVNSGDLSRTEIDLYGSSRLGTITDSADVAKAPVYTRVGMGLPDSGNVLTFMRGYKLFELSNHLGNVLATISDKKYGVSLDGSLVDHYIPAVVSANDYYPFGSQMPGRDTTLGGKYYRYGFNGKENDNEVKGVGDQQDYGMRIYDPRVGRFLSVDPVTGKYPELTPYQFASNTPISATDLDGQEAWYGNIQRGLLKLASPFLTNSQIQAANDEIDREDYNSARNTAIIINTVKNLPAQAKQTAKDVVNNVKRVVNNFKALPTARKTEIITTEAQNYVEIVTTLADAPENLGFVLGRQNNSINQQVEEYQEGITNSPPASDETAEPNAPVGPRSPKYDPNKPALQGKSNAPPLSRNANAPDFTGSPDLYPVNGNQKNTVDIVLTGSRSGDEAAANLAAGLEETPDDYTWHHLDNFSPSTGKATFQLIKTDTHRMTIPHTGAVKQYEVYHNIKYKN